MTSMYKCDKCGQIFSDYDEAYQHEKAHWEITRWSEYDNILDGMTEYKEGQEEPNIVHMCFTRWDAERQEYVKRCGKYKLVSSYDAPLIITNE